MHWLGMEAVPLFGDLKTVGTDGVEPQSSDLSMRWVVHAAALTVAGAGPT